MGRTLRVVGEVIADRYRVEEPIGSGGMSTVYRAHDTLLGRDVAIKLLHLHYGDDEGYVGRFRSEARAVAQLSHPNIVTVIDRGEADGREYIVFEYVRGEDLKEAVERRGPLPVREALEVAIGVARGLAFAHEHGIVHRDVKPQNVLMNGDGRPKVTDFGIARSLDIERGVTQTGTVLGTSNYIAPEQASGRRVDAATDVYSLGVVVFEMLTGQVPFAGDNFVVVALRHVNDEPPSVLELRPDVPVRVAALVERAMAKAPEDRFPSMDAMAAELEACLAQLGLPDDDRTMIVRSPVVRQSGRHRERAARRRLWPLVLAIALPAAAAAGAVALWPRVGGEPDEGPVKDANVPIRLTGVASYDPDGDDRAEHPEAVSRAADGDPRTYWPTSTYYGAFTKSGVGVVLDAGRPVRVRRLTLVTDTPGYVAEIRAGAAASGPFRRVSDPLAVTATTPFRVRGGAARYYLVWITELDGVARVNEVTARGIR